MSARDEVSTLLCKFWDRVGDETRIQVRRDLDRALGVQPNADLLTAQSQATERCQELFDRLLALIAPPAPGEVTADGIEQAAERVWPELYSGRKWKNAGEPEKNYARRIAKAALDAAAGQETGNG